MAKNFSLAIILSAVAFYVSVSVSSLFLLGAGNTFVSIAGDYSLGETEKGVILGFVIWISWFCATFAWGFIWARLERIDVWK